MTYATQLHAALAVALLRARKRRAQFGALAFAAFSLLGQHGVAVAQQFEDVDFLESRRVVVAQLATVSDKELRRESLRCAHDSSAQRMTPGEGHACSMIADALLYTSFNGDFAALVAWWQANRNSALAEFRR